jgi:hypothetical protein
VSAQQPTVVTSFWGAVAALTEVQRRQLLRLVTGYEAPPAGGFVALGPPHFTLAIGADPKRIPVAHTCFNTLDIPCCTDVADMQDKLAKFIEHSSGQFTLS